MLPSSPLRLLAAGRPSPGPISSMWSWAMEASPPTQGSNSTQTWLFGSSEAPAYFWPQMVLHEVVPGEYPPPRVQPPPELWLASHPKLQRAAVPRGREIQSQRVWGITAHLESSSYFLSVRPYHPVSEDGVNISNRTFSCFLFAIVGGNVSQTSLVTNDTKMCGLHGEVTGCQVTIPWMVNPILPLLAGVFWL